MTESASYPSNELSSAFHGRRVLVTGHTGFKGSWLCEWLLMMGAKVTGVALPPPENLSLCESLELPNRLDHRILDIRDLSLLQKLFVSEKFDFVFHMAAQPLVRHSYDVPLETIATNVMGTCHLLECLRKTTHPCVAVMVSSDKCYHNPGDGRRCVESDPMGGDDPYSASKGAMELICHTYRKSFFNSQHPVRLVRARAGNVIGGGDWAKDRIVPDAIRSLHGNQPIPVRNPASTRPWQHVLEPLSGYLWLAVCAQRERQRLDADMDAFNFGPEEASCPVVDVVNSLLKHWPGSWEDRHRQDAPHEAPLLALSIERARKILNWSPVWEFDEMIQHTAVWYRDFLEKAIKADALTRQQIIKYTDDALRRGLEWSQPKV